VFLYNLGVNALEFAASAALLLMFAFYLMVAAVCLVVMIVHPPGGVSASIVAIISLLVANDILDTISQIDLTGLYSLVAATIPLAKDWLSPPSKVTIYLFCLLFLVPNQLVLWVLVGAFLVDLLATRKGASRIAGLTYGLLVANFLLIRSAVELDGSADQVLDAGRPSLLAWLAVAGYSIGFGTQLSLDRFSKFDDARWSNALRVNLIGVDEVEPPPHRRPIPLRILGFRPRPAVRKITSRDYEPTDIESKTIGIGVVMFISAFIAPSMELIPHNDSAKYALIHLSLLAVLIPNGSGLAAELLLQDRRTSA
jgi:hypothetical protein